MKFKDCLAKIHFEISMQSGAVVFDSIICQL